jgi:hypothetical protein
MMFNCILLGKWLWRYGIERDVWWKVVVDSKYGSLWGGWYSLEPAKAFGVGCGRMLEKAGGLSQPVPDSKWEMGPRLAFWHDM